MSRPAPRTPALIGILLTATLALTPATPVLATPLTGAEAASDVSGRSTAVSATNGPLITDLTATPSPLDLSSGPRTVDVRARVRNGSDTTPPSFVIVNSEYGEYYSVPRTTLVSGTPQDGIWSGLITMSPKAANGQWTIEFTAEGNLVDGAPRSHTAFGTLTVTGSSRTDYDAPIITGSSVTPTTWNLADGPATLTVTVDVSDATGTRPPNVYVDSPDHTFSYYGRMGWLDGHRLEGTWTSVITVPQESGAGRYTVKVLTIDEYGNWDTTELAPVSMLKPSAVTAPAPVVTGHPRVGSILTASVDQWEPGPVRQAFQWNADGIAIPGATNSTLPLTAAHLGQEISVTVTGTRRDHIDVVKTSAPTAKVAAGPLTTGTPTVTGRATSGSTLTADPGTWGPEGVNLTYQWHADGEKIDGATGKTLTLGEAHVGQAITVTVTGSKTGYATAAQSSAPTAKVAAGTLKSATPTITGESKLGSTLTAVPGTWGPNAVELAYQWSADGSPIKDATGKTLVLSAEHVGKAITVTVTGTKAGYTTTAKSSAATAKVAAGTLKSATPTITGESKLGSTLTADSGTWRPTDVELAYQWHADGQKIGGATGKTLALGEAHVGKAITVTVTGSKTGYATAAETSTATKPVAGAEPVDPAPEPTPGSGDPTPKPLVFSDNPAGSGFYAPIQWMAAEGISVGYADGTFNKNKNVTRGETAQFIYKMTGSTYTATGSPFKDVRSAFKNAIGWFSAEEISVGYADGTFRPGQAVTRAEFAAFLYRLETPSDFTAPSRSPFSDINVGGANWKAISWLAQSGITSGYGDGSFKPSKNISRAETAAFLNRYAALSN